ncbi:MAG: FixH family protein [Deltaproteobacteria bacterium]|nr:FixH family protein [Deltaproteobacteria bacterium]
MVRVSLCTSFSLLFFVGCGSSTGAPVDADSFTTCEDEKQVMPYEPGMSVMTTAGVFTVKLLNSTPGPAVKGDNVWVIEVDDAASANALDGLDIDVVPFMPTHQHGSREVVVTPDGSGTYTLKPVYLYMSGVWEVRISIRDTVNGVSRVDAAIMLVCIP